MNYNNEANLYEHEFDPEISKIASEVTCNFRNFAIKFMFI